jgi:hypothetical protein
MIYDMSYSRDQQPAGPRPRHHHSYPVTKPSKHRQPQGEPFDPNELSRRLRLVLAEQKAHAEKKRRARTEYERQKKEREAAGVGGVAAATVGQQQSKDAAASKSTPAATSSKSGSSAAVSGPAESKSVVTPPAPKSRTAQADEDSSILSRIRNRKHPRTEPAPPPHAAYVPTEAASQFARTTTAPNWAEGQAVLSKMSRMAMKAHLDSHLENRRSVSAVPPSSTTTSTSEVPRQLRKAQSHLERLNAHPQQPSWQPHPEQIPENGALVVPEGNQRTKSHRHTFQGSLGGHTTQSIAQQGYQMRRSSTGDLLAPKLERASDEAVALNEEDEEGEADDLAALGPPDEHRVDWTQSDETREQREQRATLRPKNSIWTLRGRLGGFGKHSNGSNAAATAVDIDSNVERAMSPTSPSKGGFFARFKH